MCRYTLADINKEEAVLKDKSAKLKLAAEELDAKLVKLEAEGLSKKEIYVRTIKLRTESKDETAALKGAIRTLGEKCYDRRMELFVRSKPLPKQDMDAVAR